MKAFKFKTTTGNEYKVRFYDTGVYTVFDNNGEHEVGLWRKTEERGYEGRAFDENFTHFYFKMEDLAYWLLRVFMRRK